MSININDLTIGDFKEMQCMLGVDNTSNIEVTSSEISDSYIGKYCIIRTNSAGVWQEL